MSHILVLYYSKQGSTRLLAEEAVYGIEQSGEHQAILRTVPDISANNEQSEASIPNSGSPYVSLNDFNLADGLLLGSPAYFGNMCAPLKYFFDQTSPSWLSGKMIGKPAAVFTSSSSLHGGQESVLLNMMLPLLHHGMIIAGVPYSEPSLHTTSTGGSPYGGTHHAKHNTQELSDDEINIMRCLGKRIADLSNLLKNTEHA